MKSKHKTGSFDRQSRPEEVGGGTQKARHSAMKHQKEKQIAVNGPETGGNIVTDKHISARCD